ncbi:PAS domain-containing protein [Streptomyces sp. NBC_01800]|uniref:PAS domain-containing protein n=1 Tax=Streptomyces sp. NBC_01800 TaxID=2975945 RepID=UPI002DDBB2A7|nr:PAS domain-containing protein [Streptomyces sp. NBC_01800]WSA73174.1 PAS domain-containing protein [Streptomyces sp. NBC_01800]
MPISNPGGRPYAFDGRATAVLDSRGTVLQWTGAAADLTGLTAREVCGRPVQELLADLPGVPDTTAEILASGQVRLRHRSGVLIPVTFRATQVAGSANILVVAAPAQSVSDHHQGVALLRALSTQDRIGIVLHDLDLVIVDSNNLSRVFGCPPLPPGGRLRDVLSDGDAEDTEAFLRQVLDTGASLVLRDQPLSWQHDPARQRVMSLSAFRLEDERGHPTGVAALYSDTTDQWRARRNLDLARKTAERIGGSLDVVRTAHELADVLVPAFGDFAAVDLAQAVFDGDEPVKRLGGGDLHLRNAAMAPAAEGWPAGIKRGDPVPPFLDHPILRSFQHGETVILSRDEYISVIGDPQLVEFLLPKGCHSVMVAPLHARGALEMYMFLTFGNCDIRSAEHFSKATVDAWINKMLKTKVKRGSKIKDMSPETLRGLHGLLSSVLKEAVVAEPPLRPGGAGEVGYSGPSVAESGGS